MGNRSAKGSAFERDICKQLSLWWTENEREDIFWRTAGSGARATQRKKVGKDTFGGSGDVQALDPIGQPLIDLCSIEIKRGYSKSTPFDILDKPQKRPAQQEWEKWIAQAQRECEEASSPFWLIISKRDRREPIIAMPTRLYQRLFLEKSGWIPSSVRISYLDRSKKSNNTEVMDVAMTRFQSFLELVTAGQIRNIQHA